MTSKTEINIGYGLCLCGCGEKTTISKVNCALYGWVKGQPKKYIKYHAQLGKSHKKWKNKRIHSGYGHILVEGKGTKRIHKNGYAFEHIIIAEKAFGGPLPKDARVHHFGDVDDNSKLVICQDQEYHAFLHIRQRAFLACGDVNKRKCRYCKKYDDIENIHYKRRKNGGSDSYHKLCAREYMAKRRPDNLNWQNQKKRISNTSGFPGVSWNKRIKKWSSFFCVGGKTIWCGHFGVALEAALARFTAEVWCGKWTCNYSSDLAKSIKDVWPEFNPGRCL